MSKGKLREKDFKVINVIYGVPFLNICFKTCKTVEVDVSTMTVYQTSQPLII